MNTERALTALRMKLAELDKKEEHGLASCIFVDLYAFRSIVEVLESQAEEIADLRNKLEYGRGDN